MLMINNIIISLFRCVSWHKDSMWWRQSSLATVILQATVQSAQYQLVKPYKAVAMILSRPPVPAVQGVIASSISAWEFLVTEAPPTVVSTLVVM